MEILPDHILIEIFEYLNCLEIIKALRVCKRWNKLIVTSPRIMKKFSYSWDVFHNLADYTKDPSLQLKYIDEFEAKLAKFPFRNADIYATQMPLRFLDRFVEIFQKYLTKVEKLTIACPYKTGVLPILSLTSNLVELNIEETFDAKINEFEAVNLPKLKHLRLQETTSVLSKIHAENLRTIELRFCKDEGENVENFFMRAKNLKSMTFCFCEIIRKFSRYDQMPFKLEHLQVSGEFPLNQLEYTINFLFSQAQNLKNLKISNDLDCKEILDIAIGHMKLESLYCFGRIDIEQGIDILNNIEENFTIKDLRIQFDTYNGNSRVDINNMNIELGIIKKCKALETLKFDFIKGKFEDFIREIQSCKFKILYTRFDHSLKSTDLKYERLEVLNITENSYSTEFEGVLNLIVSFPNIKKIYFEKISDNIDPEKFHKIFKTCQKLEEIKINLFENNLDNLYDIFNSQDCHIKKLKIEENLKYRVRFIEEKFKNVPFEVKVLSLYDNPKEKWVFGYDFFGSSLIKDDEF